MFAKLQDEFTARGCALLAVCSDESKGSEHVAEFRVGGCEIRSPMFAVEAIEEWIVGVEETQDCKVLFPILADVEEKLAQTMVRVAENGHDIVVFKVWEWRTGSITSCTLFGTVFLSVHCGSRGPCGVFNDVSSRNRCGLRVTVVSCIVLC